MARGSAGWRLVPRVYSDSSGLAALDPSAECDDARGKGYEVCKRTIDVAGAATLLVMGVPLLAAIAVAVKLTSPGPVLFAQRRLGRGGLVFRCYKFRTMVAAAESKLATDTALNGEFDANFKLRNDPRITRIGGFLRRTSLDELPQLWNVLRGDMSLIGPRPIVEKELRKYGDHGERLLTVKPGLGGLWQVSGRSDTTYPERVALDMSYIAARSTVFDLYLLAQTVLVVLRGDGAY